MCALNDEQLEVLEHVKNKHNIFLTGSPGSGKSFCVKNINSILTQSGVKYGITAMTGSAAILINGTTLHSFLGIGLAKNEPRDIIFKMLPEKYNLISSLECLLIDECSMLSDQLFNKIDDICKIIKNNNLAFGGVQIILVGDGFQLAPIEGTYCFLSKNFTNFKVIQLNKNMRQRDDVVFKKILDNIRWGNCLNSDLKILKSLSNNVFSEGIVPTKLFSRNIDIDRINTTELEKLNLPLQEYSIKYNNKVSKKYIDSNKIPLKIDLCIGAQVIVTRNISIEDRIINGTRGIVIGLLPKSVIIKTLNNSNVIIDYFLVKDSELNFNYIPLKLAWAVTIHSSQGMTLDALEIDLDNIFAFGQSYTGLSRAKDLKSIRITNVSKCSFKTNPRVIEFYNQLVKDSI